MTGIRPRNFRPGDIAEYFAIWGMSSIAQVIPVPRQEDYGIDLSCGLTRISKNDLIVENVFGIQVKNYKKNIRIKYGGIDKDRKWKKYEIEWLLFKPHHPFLILIADMDAKKIDLFTTSPMWHVRWHTGYPYPYQINLIPYKTGDTTKKIKNDIEEKTKLNKLDYGDCKIWNVNLGDPIISLYVDDFLNKNKQEEIYKILKFWIEFDQRNVTHQLLNIPYCEKYNAWETNLKPKYNNLVPKVFGSTSLDGSIDNILKMLKTMKPMIDTLSFQLKLQQNKDNKVVKEFYSLLNDALNYYGSVK